MRIYSSLSPLDLHARGAELCRVILLRDAECMRLYGHRASLSPSRADRPPSSHRLTPSPSRPADSDRLQTFKVGPVIAAIDSCGFSTYDEQSLWHHALQTYLQLCVRYPPFREGKVRPRPAPSTRPPLSVSVSEQKMQIVERR